MINTKNLEEILKQKQVELFRKFIKNMKKRSLVAKDNLKDIMIKNQAETIESLQNFINGCTKVLVPAEMVEEYQTKYPSYASKIEAVN